MLEEEEEDSKSDSFEDDVPMQDVSLLDKMIFCLEQDMRKMSIEQKTAVKCSSVERSTCCVVAIPGAGKTSVLVSRALHLSIDYIQRIRSQNGELKDIPLILLTFTRSAREEMEERLRGRIKYSLNRNETLAPKDHLSLNSIVISTYHDFFFKILKQERMPKKTSIFVVEDEIKMIHTLWKEKKYDFSKSFAEKNIGRWKMADICSNIRLTLSEKMFLDEYKKKKKKEYADCFSYDDILVSVYEMRKRIIRWFSGQHILLDESQDMDFLSFSVFKEALEKCASLFLVGDQYQRIYNINSDVPQVDFEELVKGNLGTNLKLTKNFRSNVQLQTLFEEYRKESNLLWSDEESEYGSEKSIFLVRVSDENQEYECIVHFINELLAQDDQKTIAIIARTNRELKALSVYLDGLGLLYMLKDEVNMNSEGFEIRKKEKKKKDSEDPKPKREKESKYNPSKPKEKKGKKKKKEEKTAWKKLKKEKKKRVLLTTAHRSKGTEYNFVFVLNCVDGVFPKKFLNEETDLKFEENILYVAMTRAIEKLYILVPMFLTGYCLSGDIRSLSRFFENSITYKTKDLLVEVMGIDVIKEHYQEKSRALKENELEKIGLTDLNNLTLFGFEECEKEHINDMSDE